MDIYFIVKTLHIVSATILFGTGLGIAFFMFRSHFSSELAEKRFAARNTVLADYLFTFPAAVIQPVSGFWLISIVGFNWSDFWLVATYCLYIVAGLCWLPVVWIQIQLKKMVEDAFESKSELPERYNQLFKVWFLLGWPAFLSFIAIFFLMVLKPL